MDIYMMIIPVASFIAAIFLWFLFWGIKNRQFEDIEAPKHRILFDDELVQPTKSVIGQQENAKKQNSLKSKDDDN